MKVSKLYQYYSNKIFLAKHDRESTELAKIYQTKIDALEKLQKHKIEKMESSQAKEQKEMISTLKREQSKELAAFQQNQSHAHSELKRQGKTFDRKKDDHVRSK